jgi:ureidoglycolate hydrolase
MREVQVVTVVAEPLERTAWEPFGWLPVADSDPADGRGRLEFEWGDAHVNFISHAPTEIERTTRGARCDRMYRHDTHTQTLMPLNCESVVAVAPASIDFAARDDATTIRAFRLRPLDCFVLARGTWHWGPFPLGDEPVRLWNLQGLRYAEDNASVDLAARLGAPVEIVA